jgi:hypothetical protein
LTTIVSLGVKLVYVLGITNIIGLLLILLSCRCTAGRRIVGRLWRYGWYKKFYNKHCYYWWFFIASVLLHTATALLVFGSPL